MELEGFGSFNKAEKKKEKLVNRACFCLLSSKRAIHKQLHSENKQKKDLINVINACYSVSNGTEGVLHLGLPLFLFSSAEMPFFTTYCPRPLVTFALLTAFTGFFWRNFFTSSENKISTCFGENFLTH